jgi:hypothetical protein
MNALRHMSGAAPAASGRNALADMAEMLRQQGQVSASGVPDEYLVHINRREYEMLDRETDGVSTNPVTGLPQFLEGDSGGVGDTGGASPGSNSNGAGPMGGENAATGSAFGSTADRDAAYGGGWGDIGGGISDFFNDPVAFANRNLQPNTATPGVIGMMTGMLTGGLLGTAGMAAMSAAAQTAGDAITGWAQDTFGVQASAPPGTKDYSYDTGPGGGGEWTPPKGQVSGPSVGGISLGGNQNALAQMGRGSGSGVYIGSMRG